MRELRVPKQNCKVSCCRQQLCIDWPLKYVEGALGTGKRRMCGYVEDQGLTLGKGQSETILGQKRQEFKFQISRKPGFIPGVTGGEVDNKAGEVYN